MPMQTEAEEIRHAYELAERDSLDGAATYVIDEADRLNEIKWNVVDRVLRQ